MPNCSGRLLRPSGHSSRKARKMLRTTHTHTDIHTNKHTHTHRHTHKQTHTHTPTRTHTLRHTHTHKKKKDTHTHKKKNTHTHPHTHTHPRARAPTHPPTHPSPTRHPPTHAHTHARTNVRVGSGTPPAACYSAFDFSAVCRMVYRSEYIWVCLCLETNHHEAHQEFKKTARRNINKYDLPVCVTCACLYANMGACIDEPMDIAMLGPTFLCKGFWSCQSSAHHQRAMSKKDPQ